MQNKSRKKCMILKFFFTRLVDVCMSINYVNGTVQVTLTFQ
jgi:hypothetical protein